MAQENAVADLASSSYEEQRSAYGCTSDCSGHKAGYSWAAENSVTDTAECDDNNKSFIEGYMAFAEAVEAEAETSVKNHHADY